MDAYQGTIHWQKQKAEMFNGLIAQGIPPEQATKLVAQITGLQRGAGNIPGSHPDSGSAITPHNTLRAQDNEAFPVGPPSPPQVAPPSPPQVAAAPASGMTPPGLPSSPGGSASEQPSIFDNPDAVGSILGMGDLNRQMSYAEGLRDQEMPGGRYVSNGRIYTASNPLEHLAAGYGKVKGKRDATRIGGELTDAKKKLIELLRGGGTPVGKLPEMVIPGRM